MPQHVAIIMDGNGRWAKKRLLPRVVGHARGVEAVRRTVKACLELKIPYLTLFAFSSENWRRPAKEVDFLLRFSLSTSFLIVDKNKSIKKSTSLAGRRQFSELKAKRVK